MTLKIMPFDSYVIETTSLVSELVTRLQLHTEQPHFIRTELPNSEFVGWVSDEGFRLKPVMRTGASFVPELFGRFVCHSEGTQVVVEVIPSSAALTVIAALAGTIGMMVFYSGSRVYLAISGEIVLAWFFSVMGFWLDAGKSHANLVNVLCGRPVDSSSNAEIRT